MSLLEQHAASLRILPADAPPGLLLVNVTGDGNCLFHAVSLALSVQESDVDAPSPSSLRAACADELAANAEYYAKFFVATAQQCAQERSTSVLSLRRSRQGTEHIATPGIATDLGSRTGTGGGKISSGWVMVVASADCSCGDVHQEAHKSCLLRRECGCSKILQCNIPTT